MRLTCWFNVAARENAFDALGIVLELGVSHFVHELVHMLLIGVLERWVPEVLLPSPFRGPLQRGLVFPGDNVRQQVLLAPHLIVAQQLQVLLAEGALELLFDLLDMVVEFEVTLGVREVSAQLRVLLGRRLGLLLGSLYLRVLLELLLKL